MSSLIYLGFSIVTFILSFGIMFMLLPMVLGTFFSLDVPISDPLWSATQARTEVIVQWLIPLTASLGIFVLVLRVMMAASAKGRD